MNDNPNTTTPGAEEKTFTQTDVNRIVQERLAKEKGKTDAALAEREQELVKREFMLTAKETLTQKGLSVDLLEALNTSSPEAFEKSLAIIEKMKTTPPPSGGSPARVSSGGVHSETHETGDSIRKAMGLN